jgi:hypothetical protein
MTAPTLIQLQASFKLKCYVAGIERYLAEFYEIGSLASQDREVPYFCAANGYS